MIAYHGTTRARARKIFEQGLLPLPPSRRVWFAESREYAMHRARTWARRTQDEPVVLACNLDLAEVRRILGGAGVVYRRGIIAIDRRVSVEMMHSLSMANLATEPIEVAAWVNSLLGVRRKRSVGPDHPGVVRLSNWINSHVEPGSKQDLLSSQLMARARRWLPEYFAGARLTTRRLRSHAQVGLAEYRVDPHTFGPDARVADAFRCLEGSDGRERARGLKLLEEVGVPDLFEWCSMFLEDEDMQVRVAALNAMLGSDDVSPEVIEPLADCGDRDVRKAAIAVLAKRAGEDSPKWIRAGLCDPEPCVRVAAARYLSKLDRRRHKPILELAGQDPNPDIAARAQKMLNSRRRTKPLVAARYRTA